MLLAVDRHNGIPAYRQIMDQVKFHVAAGRLQPGEALPSTRSLGEELGINPMTISKAYNLLEREGIVTRAPGKLLIVNVRNQRTNADARDTQLRKCLAPVVTQVMQLGVDAHTATRLFQTLLAEQIETQEKARHDRSNLRSRARKAL